MGYKDKKDLRLISYQKEYYQKNKEKVLTRQRKRKSEIKDRTLKNLYGISLKEWELQLVQQENCCAMCRIEFTQTPHTDHNHTTDKVRGLLCKSCNMKVGIYEKDREKIEDYLKRYPQ